ncbi:hypothetical protein PVK06_014746 [Gossypium arboreum]|uniref:Pleiotropic drug resistance protein 1-like n=1 Tax=Gossypium arboreum TaxID=29729 RepID=A0ABR0PVE7_GOSAR|nr:hypothetical protein PVK06_014746 [Gossypium arboreum]
MKRNDLYQASNSLRANGSSRWRDTGYNVFSRSFRQEDDDDDEKALKWAAIERLPTFARLKKALLTTSPGETSEVDVPKLGHEERKKLMDRLIKHTEKDNESFLLKIRQRVDRQETVLFAVPLAIFFFSLSWSILHCLHLLSSRKKQLSILRDVSGTIRPCRMTLLLGPPSSGKTTLLLALAGKLNRDLKFSGRVTYNGHEMKDFVPQRIAAYICQNDLHLPEWTVRETIAFSARCQGVGPSYEMLAELARREKAANIKPDPDIDAFMKAASIGDQETSVLTDYIIKILGLENCADTLVGNEMIRGISGGQRKRVTTDSTVLVMVTSRKDQRQYWNQTDKAYSFVTVEEFAVAFQSFHVGKRLQDDLATPFDKNRSDPTLLTTKNYGVNKRELLKACFSKELSLMKRNSFIYIFKLIQLVVMAVIGSTVFLRTEMHKKTPTDGIVQMGAVFFSVFMFMFSGLSELAMTGLRLPVFFKQRDNLFYPAWVYALPTWILNIPISFIEVALWVVVTYYAMGLDPDIFRFLKQFLLLVLTNQMSSALFRLVAALGREMTVTNTLSSFCLLVLFANCGYVLSQDEVRKWWIWAYWISPMMYSQNAIVINEFLGESWNHVLPFTTEKLGVLVLKSRGFFSEAYWYWIGVGALVGFILVLNFLNTLALTYLNPLDEIQRVKSEDQNNEDDDRNGVDAQLQHKGSNTDLLRTEADPDKIQYREKGMILPFLQHCITFEKIVYAVDMPQGIEGISRIKDGYNPATWMLEVSTPEQEMALGVDFADLYESSELHKRNKALIEQLNVPSPGSKQLHFPSRYSRSFFSQFLVCLWKQRWSYWRNTSYTAVVVELPYILVQAATYGIIVYSMMAFEWSAAKFLWYIFFMYFTLLYFTFFGMMTMAITPNFHVAAIISTAFYGLWNLFTGFIVPRTRIPIWWRWNYWICPMAWTLYGLIVSQYGDVKDVLDAGETTEEFLKKYFGFRHDFVGVVAAVIVGWALLFAFLFAVSIKLFNFQRR